MIFSPSNHYNFRIRPVLLTRLFRSVIRELSMPLTNVTNLELKQIILLEQSFLWHLSDEHLDRNEVDEDQSLVPLHLLITLFKCIPDGNSSINQYVILRGISDSLIDV